MRTSSLRMLALFAVVACGVPPAERPQPPPSVIVHDAGAEPRQWLKFAPALHVPERIVISEKLRGEVDFTNTVLEQGKRSTDWPMVNAQVRLEASEGTGGDLIVTMTIEHVDVGDDFVAPWTHEWAVRDAARLEGLHASWHLKPSGEISHLDIEPSKRTIRIAFLQQLLADAAAHTSVLFPAVPIGSGATWQVTERKRVGSETWDFTSTYRLRELSAEGAVIEVSTASSAQEQTLHAEPNASKKLTSGSGSGTGQWIVPLHGIAVIGSGQFTGAANFLIVDHHKRIQSTVKNEVLVYVKRLNEPSPDPSVAP